MILPPLREVKKFVAIDLETYMFKEMEITWKGKKIKFKDGTPPDPICMSWCGHPTHYEGVTGSSAESDPFTGLRGDGVFNVMNHFLEEALQGKYDLVGHNIKFDMIVLTKAYPVLIPKIFECYERGIIHDTLLMERLFRISTTGQAEGRFSLDRLVMSYFKKDISDSKAEGAVRYDYGRMKHVPVEYWPRAYRDYPLEDVRWTLRLAQNFQGLKTAFGYGSINRNSCRARYDYCLGLLEWQGMPINKKKAQELLKEVNEKAAPSRKILLDKNFAYMQGLKMKMRQKEFRLYLEKFFPELIKWTKKTKKSSDKWKPSIDISSKALDDFPEGDEVIDAWKETQFWNKFESTYLPKMIVYDKYHYGYDVQKNTMRTSGFVQTMPSTKGLREIHEYPEGKGEICTVDLAGIELVSVAHQTYIAEGIESKELWKRVNSGEKPADLHAIMGSAVELSDKGKSEEEIRAMVKTGEFQEYVKEFEKRKGEKDPDALFYRKDNKFFGLGFFGGIGEVTAGKCTKSNATPHKLLGIRRIHAIVLPEIVEYLGFNSKRDDESLRGTEGWINTQREDARTYGYSVNDCYRAKCGFCQMGNGYSMQTPTAWGFLSALWDWTRACYDWSRQIYWDMGATGIVPWEDGAALPIAEIHDEIVSWFREDGDEANKFKLDVKSNIMCEGVQDQLYSVRVTVEGGIMKAWTKNEDEHKMLTKTWVDPDPKYLEEANAA